MNVIQELNEKIISIDFIHAHKLTYDVISHRVKFTRAGTNSTTTLKNIVLPAVVKAKFKGQCNAQATYVANICVPRTPMVLGMPAIINVDKNNICSTVVENCAPYTLVTLEGDDILGIIEIEEEEMVPSRMILSHASVKTFTTAFRK